LRSNNRQQSLVVPWLGNEIAGAAFHCFHGQFDGGPGRHYHDRQCRVDFLNFYNRRQAFLARRGVARVIQIHQQQRILFLFQRVKDARKRGDSFRLVAFAFQQDAQCFEHIPLIVR
jgi:hypothetical protein